MFFLQKPSAPFCCQGSRQWFNENRQGHISFLEMKTILASLCVLDFLSTRSLTYDQQLHCCHLTAAVGGNLVSLLCGKFGCGMRIISYAFHLFSSAPNSWIVWLSIEEREFTVNSSLLICDCLYLCFRNEVLSAEVAGEEVVEIPVIQVNIFCEMLLHF